MAESGLYRGLIDQLGVRKAELECQELIGLIDDMCGDVDGSGIVETEWIGLGDYLIADGVFADSAIKFGKARGMQGVWYAITGRVTLRNGLIEEGPIARIDSSSENPIADLLGNALGNSEYRELRASIRMAHGIHTQAAQASASA